MGRFMQPHAFSLLRFWAIACAELAFLTIHDRLVSDLLSETAHIAQATPFSTTPSPSYLAPISPTPFYQAAMSSPIVGNLRR